MKGNHAPSQCQGLASPKLQKVERKTACSGQQSWICVEGCCWRRSMEIPCFFHPLPQSSHAVLHSARKTVAVKCSWAVISNAVNKHWFTSLGDKSTFWPSVTSGSGFLLMHIHAKQNYLHWNHWHFLESNRYERVGPLARSPNEARTVWQRLCLSECFVHSRTWGGSTASKIALIMKCQYATLKLLALHILVIWKQSASPTAVFRASGFGHSWIFFLKVLSDLSQALFSNECKWKLWLSISKQAIVAHRTLFLQLIRPSDARA